tara:strand:+ start:599 stop:1645 length:1047 start_codon:yes stop_codon:yes gene_type:complete
MGGLKYERLRTLPGGIRILHISRPKRDNDLFECTLRTIEYEQIRETSYQALSYEWGNENKDDDPHIIVNGCRVQIRKNLHDALEQIWKTSKDGTMGLWIDALCINQADAAETSQQIGFMGEIFKNAHCVFAWLGSERENSNFAMDWMADRSPSRIPLDPTTTEAMDAICHRSFWQRVWIIQELFLARSCVVLCGDRSISRDNFESSLGDLNATRSQQDLVKNPVVQHMLRRNTGTTKYNTLRTWLGACIRGGFECSKEHDRIYGLLGVAGDCKGGKIEAKYDKPLRDVYLEALAVTSPWKPNWDEERIMIPLAKQMNLEVNADLQYSVQMKLSTRFHFGFGPKQDQVT